MRVFVTGLHGFAGRWLESELRSAGHEPFPPSDSRVDVAVPDELVGALCRARPDAVVHLAAVSATGQAAADPLRAFRTAIGGTVNLMEALAALSSPAAVLVVSSSAVYGGPEPTDLPLRESAPLRPHSPYALAKMAQESVALAYAARMGLRVAVVRQFSHTGPGQRPDFVVPALAQRVLKVSRGEADHVPVGNLEVKRDYSDVRDVVRAYRLLLEGLVAGSVGDNGLIINVASGRSVTIRWMIERLCQAAGVLPVIRVEPTLTREDDPEEIRGDAGRLTELTGWRPQYTLDETLLEVWRATARSARPL